MNKIIEISSTDEFLTFIEDNQACAIYFSGENCSVCKALKPKLIELFQSRYTKIAVGIVETENSQEIASQNSIFTIPTLLIFFNGSEFIRKSRTISIHELEKEVDRPYELLFG